MVPTGSLGWLRRGKARRDAMDAVRNFAFTHGHDADAATESFTPWVIHQTVPDQKGRSKTMALSFACLDFPKER